MDSGCQPCVSQRQSPPEILYKPHPVPLAPPRFLTLKAYVFHLQHIYGGRWFDFKLAFLKLFLDIDPLFFRLWRGGRLVEGCLLVVSFPTGVHQICLRWGVSMAKGGGIRGSGILIRV